VTHFWYFAPSSRISGTVEGRNLKFGMEIARKELYDKNAKLGQEGLIVCVCCVSDLTADWSLPISVLVATGRGICRNCMPMHQLGN